ncbi:MAG TPA: hypothetical protein VKH34_04810 [Vicinamibacterales bacterium]|nr:hypothetical protein [Vicinamibacterales bacterium]
MRRSPIGLGARAALGLLACALTGLAYQRAFELPFVFDDRITVLLNPALVQPWDWRALLGVWGLPAPGASDVVRAAGTVSFAVDRALWGFSSFGYHLTNVVLHIVVVALFYGTCTRALADSVSDRGQTGVKPGSDLRQSRVEARSDPGLTHDQAPGIDWAAFFAAAAFGLHPVMSSTVLYVSARPEMVGAAAFMIALMFARRAILTSGPAPALLATAFGAAAFAASPACAGLPIVVLAYDAWLLRTKGWRRRLWRAYVPAMTMVILILGWRLAVEWPGMNFAGPLAAFVTHDVLTESIGVWRYLALVVVPMGQAIVHDARWVDSLADPVAWLSLAGIVAAVAGAIRLRRTAPLVSVGVIWFFGGLAAASTMVPHLDVMAEPRVYLAAAGLIFAIFAAALPYLVARRAPRIAATAVLSVLVVLTVLRIRVWSDPLTLWTEAVTRAPGAWRGHLEFAEALKEVGQCDRAAKEIAAAGELNAHLALQPPTGWAPCPRPPRRP